MGWTTPDGEDPRKFWKFVGAKTITSSVPSSVPPGQGYVVGDIKSAGKTIDFGAQIADFITIKLEGLATRIGQSAVAPFQDASTRPSRLPPSVGRHRRESPRCQTCRSAAGSAVGDAGTTGTAALQLMAAGGGVAAEESAEKALMARLPERLRRS